MFSGVMTRSRMMRIGAPGMILVAISCHGQALSPDPERPGNWLLWTSPGSISGAPAKSGGAIYFGTKNHEVIAVNAATSAVLWRKVTTTSSGETRFGRNVILASGNVLFGDHALYAFDAATGARQWVFDPEAQALPGHGVGAYALATDGTIVFAGSGSGHVYAIRAADGSLLWVSAIATDGNSSAYDPLIDGGSLYVAVRHFTNPVTGAVFALDRTDGRVLWTHKFEADPLTGSGPARQLVAFDNLVVASNDDGKIYAFDKQTGRVEWVAPRRPDVVGYNDMRPLALAGNVLIAGSLTRFITAYDVSNGEQLWETDGGEGSSGNQLVTDDVAVYVPYMNGVMGAFDVQTGRKRWLRFAPNHGLYVSYPLVSEEIIYAPSTTGLVALKK